MAAKRSRDKTVLSKQDISTRKKSLKEQKLQAPTVGKRAIVGVVLMAVSVLSLLAVASFDAHDRVGPGFKNAVGPVGHALAEALRGLLGLCAYALPVVGIYGAFLVFLGDRSRRRWPQMLSLGLLLIAVATLFHLFFAKDAGWAHPPGGVVGRALGETLSALFSTVGTVVLVSALGAVALIVGTQFAFLRFCSWAWAQSMELVGLMQVHGLKFFEVQKQRMAERRAAQAKAEEEEAKFLAQLEAQEAELEELEDAVAEAEEIAEENARLKREAEAQKLAAKLEKEQRGTEKDKARRDRDVKNLALQIAAQRLATAPNTLPPSAVEADEPAPAPGADPAWAMAFSPSPVTLPPAPVGKRMPTIVAPPAPPMAAFESLPPQQLEAAASQFQAAAEVLSTRAPVALESSAAAGALAAPVAAGAMALSRMPVIIEPKAPPKPTKKKEQEQFQFIGDRKSFVPPPIDVLESPHRQRTQLDKDSFLATAEKLRSKLADFGIVGEVVEIRPGPVVTMYEFLPGPGIKVSKIAGLQDDLAMAMEAMRVRIVAPIPGKGVVGIEVPNKDRETVFLKEIAEQDAFTKSASRLTMCVGKDIEGMPYVLDLGKAPHLLIAGTTGSGKSVAVNSMIMSILLKSTPEEVRFIMVDPKMLELSVYEGIPHLLLPVVTDPRKAALALQWAVDEMTRRYRLLADAGVRNLAGYNALVETEKKAKDSVIEARAIKVPPRQEQPAAAPTLDAAPTPAAPALPPAKKRKLLIVDVADEAQQAAPPIDAAPPEAAPAQPALGVKAPSEEPQDPREALPPEVQAELKAVVTQAEIRVEEPTEEEAAALAEAAAAAAAGPGADEPAAKVKLPYIVIIIDELADLMMVASKEVETSVARLAQMARAAGIHLMVATQRPSTDVVTGIIKANFPTRVSFMLRSKPDSMTILGTVGAEALLGMGDMLILPPTSAHLQRVHGAFVSEVEIKRAVDHLKAQGKPVFDESILKAREEDGATDGGEEDELADELYDQAVAIVSEMRQVSISILQRKMRIGYNRSARMIERMERDGMVGPADGAKPREVLMRPVGEMPGAGAMG